MATDPVPLAYATPEPVIDAMNQARRIVAWFAVGYAVTIGLSDVLNVVWMWRVTQFRWLRLAFPIAAVPFCVTLAIGGAMALRGRPAGPFVIRVAALSLWITTMTSGIAMQLYARSPSGMVAYQFLEMTTRVLLYAALPAFNVPALLFCLSFPLRRAR